MLALPMLPKHLSTNSAAQSKTDTSLAGPANRQMMHWVCLTVLLFQGGLVKVKVFSQGSLHNPSRCPCSPGKVPFLVSTTIFCCFHVNFWSTCSPALFQSFPVLGPWRIERLYSVLQQAAQHKRDDRFQTHTPPVCQVALLSANLHTVF